MDVRREFRVTAVQNTRYQVKTRQTGNINELVTYERYGATTRSGLAFTYYTRTMTKGFLSTRV